MTISDIIIIYFSLGAPFAVYQFTQEQQTSSFRVVISTAFSFLFWLPLLSRLGVAKILRSAGNDDFAEGHDSDADLDKDIRNAQSAVADRFRMAPRHISIHEFREILERYAGLSLLVNHRASGSSKIANEIFSIAGRENTQLAAVCFERRNRARLIRHHIDASGDFLRVINECSFLDEKMLPPAIRLTEFLSDLPATLELLANLQTRKLDVPVIDGSGEVLWLPEIKTASKSERLVVTT